MLTAKDFYVSKSVGEYTYGIRLAVRICRSQTKTMTAAFIKASKEDQIEWATRDLKEHLWCDVYQELSNNIAGLYHVVREELHNPVPRIHIIEKSFQEILIKLAPSNSHD